MEVIITMTAIITLVYWWIHGEVVREIKILELLSDTEFFHVNFML